MMAANVELDALVGRYQHESHRPRADQALHMLRKVASIVKPIMRRRNWRVGLLAEFVPDEERLLGLNTNRGQIIHLRLRYQRDHSNFLALEDVVDTMLHELCHNEIGPHNSQFHALWDQLRDEHEALVRKGYTGEGFLGRGERLGGQRLPLHEARRRARVAAEQRQVRSAGSGQKLGGSGILRGQDARAVIAAAVERRIRVERGCVSGTDVGRKIARDEAIKKEDVTVTEAEREDENEATIMQAYIDLIEEEESLKFGSDYVPPSAENPAGPRGMSATTHDFSSSRSKANAKAKALLDRQREIEQGLRREAQSSSTSSSFPTTQPNQAVVAQGFAPHSSAAATATGSSPPENEKEDENESWTCEICTLINPINYLTCAACTIERPSPAVPLSTKPNNTTVSNPTRGPKRPSTTKSKNSSTSAEAHERFSREQAHKIAAAPLGWRCAHCGSFMELQWWTCSLCGRMKERS